MARYYERYTYDTFGVRAVVGKKDYARFQKRSNELERLGIFPKDYAKRLLPHLTWFVKKKKWRCVPINTFLGKYAQEVYLKEIGNKAFDAITADEADSMLLVLDEFKIVSYIHQTHTPFRSAVKELWPVLGGEWQQLFSSSADRSRITSEALEMFNNLMGTTFQTYRDVNNHAG